MNVTIYYNIMSVFDVYNVSCFTQIVTICWRIDSFCDSWKLFLIKKSKSTISSYDNRVKYNIHVCT